MRKILLALLLVFVLLAVALPCAADYGDDVFIEYRPHWDIRAGAVFPNADTVDNVEVLVGVEYEYPAPSLGGYLTLSADYTAITSRRLVGATTVQDDVTLIPVLLNYKRDATAEDAPVYFGVGLGFFWAQDPIPEMRLSDDISFAWQLMAGMQWLNGFFAEGRYIAGNNPSDDGLGIVDIGFRF